MWAFFGQGMASSAIPACEAYIHSDCRNSNARISCAISRPPTLLLNSGYSYRPNIIFPCYGRNALFFHSRNSRKNDRGRYQMASAAMGGIGTTGADANSSSRTSTQRTVPGSDKAQEPLRLLCLSNGHGEDTIAVAILKQLRALAQRQGRELVIEALPIVGMGHAYQSAGFPIMCRCQPMPSGGFVYMDRMQLVGDVKAGLLELTKAQLAATKEWVCQHPTGVLLAVGDVVPLAFAWFMGRWPGGQQRTPDMAANGMRYGYVGTVRSEFYIRTPDGNKIPGSRDWAEDSISRDISYLPWERAMMSAERCRFIVPRDTFTSQLLREALPPRVRSRVLDLGNPMMDGLEPRGDFDAALPGVDVPLALLPGSRAPEVYNNFALLLSAAFALARRLHPRHVSFLCPLVPSLPRQPFLDVLASAGWRREGPPGTSCERYTLEKGAGGAGSGGGPVVSVVVRAGGFNDAVQKSVGALAMAGTACEQVVGLGKPVFSLPGQGPQFTYKFAEAQQRLLGPSVLLCKDPEDLASTASKALSDQAFLSTLGENGRLRMGTAGAAQRIADVIWDHLLLSP
eukprot:jgi/Mesvir1/23058/Mv08171-RA.1